MKKKLEMIRYNISITTFFKLIYNFSNIYYFFCKYQLTRIGFHI